MKLLFYVIKSMLYEYILLELFNLYNICNLSLTKMFKQFTKFCIPDIKVVPFSHKDVNILTSLECSNAKHVLGSETMPTFLNY